MKFGVHVINIEMRFFFKFMEKPKKFNPWEGVKVGNSEIVPYNSTC